MWSRFGITALGLSMTLSIVQVEASLAVQVRDYTPRELRSVLNGLGYNVAIDDNPLTDAASQQAIREFQTYYRLPADGIAGTATHNKAKEVITNLQRQLNLVAKPSPPLPGNQFYGPQTAGAVQLFQNKLACWKLVLPRSMSVSS